MEFSTREDIEAPIDYVFDQVTDFAAIERSIMRRGADIERIEAGAPDGLGAKWRVKFQMRGVERAVVAEITSVDKPNAITVTVTSRNVDAVANLDLVALSRARTRLNIETSARAKTLPAKLLFQSARFARQRTQGRFKNLMAGFAKSVETRYRS